MNIWNWHFVSEPEEMKWNFSATLHFLGTLGREIEEQCHIWNRHSSPRFRQVLIDQKGFASAALPKNISRSTQKKRQCQNLHGVVGTRIFVILHFESKKCIVVLGKCFHRIAKSMFEVDDVEYVNILMEEIFFFLFFFTKEKNALQISLRMPSCPCPVFLYMKVCHPFSVQLFRPFAFSFSLQGNIHLVFFC